MSRALKRPVTYKMRHERMTVALLSAMLANPEVVSHRSINSRFDHSTISNLADIALDLAQDVLLKIDKKHPTPLPQPHTRTKRPPNPRSVAATKAI